MLSIHPKKLLIPVLTWSSRREASVGYGTDGESIVMAMGGSTAMEKGEMVASMVGAILQETRGTQHWSYEMSQGRWYIPAGRSALDVGSHEGQIHFKN